jgi:hypothetical protein
MSRYSMTARRCASVCTLGIMGAGAGQLSSTIGTPRGPRPRRPPAQIGPPLEGIGAAAGTGLGGVVGGIGGYWTGMGIGESLNRGPEGPVTNPDTWADMGAIIGAGIGGFVGWGFGTIYDWSHTLHRALTGGGGSGPSDQ